MHSKFFIIKPQDLGIKGLKKLFCRPVDTAAEELAKHP